jgi:hypothetical protein
MFRVLLSSFLLFPLAVSADDEIFEWLRYETVHRCTQKSNLYMTYLREQHGETPLFLGDSSIMQREFQVDQGRLGFFVNQKTGTYTVTIMFEDGVICEITVGENFTPY